MNTDGEGDEESGEPERKHGNARVSSGAGEPTADVSVCARCHVCCVIGFV